MFNIKDYYTTAYATEERLEQNSSITVKITIDEKKIEEDINQFCEILKRLEKLIGPYTIKVSSKKTKIKKKKK